MNVKFRWASAVGYTFYLAVVTLAFHFVGPLAAHAGSHDNDSLERSVRNFGVGASEKHRSSEMTFLDSYIRGNPAIGPPHPSQEDGPN